MIKDGHFISQAAAECLRATFDSVAVTPQATINPLAYGPDGKDAFAVEAGFDLGIGKRTMLGLAYTGQFSGDTKDNAVKADLTVKF